MAQPNALNPSFQGVVTAGGFKTGIETETQTLSVVGVRATGTTSKNVFRSPIGFGLRIITAWAVAVGGSSATISLMQADGTVIALTTTGSGTGIGGFYSTRLIGNSVLGAEDTLHVVSTSSTDETPVFIAYQVT